MSVENNTKHSNQLEVSSVPVGKHEIIEIEAGEKGTLGQVLKDHAILDSIQETGSDFSSLIKKSINVYGLSKSYISGMDPAATVEMSNVTKSLNLIGVTSLLSTFTSFYNGKRTLSVAKNIDDSHAERTGKITIARTPLRVASTLLSIPSTVVGLANISMTSQLTTTLKTIGIASSAISGLNLVGLLTNTSLSLHEVLKNSKNFKKALSEIEKAKKGTKDEGVSTYDLEQEEKKAIQALIKVLMSDENIDKVLEKGVKKFKKNSYNALKLLFPADKFKLTESEYLKIKQVVAEEREKDSSITDRRAQRLEAYLISEVKKKYIRNHQSFIRTFGSNCLEKLIDYEKTLIEYENANEDYKASLKETKQNTKQVKMASRDNVINLKDKLSKLRSEIITEAKQKSTKQTLLSSLTIIASSIGLGLIVAGNLISGGVLELAVQIVSLVTSAIFVGLDIHAVYQGVKLGKLKPIEKIFAIALASIVVAAIVGAHIFSGGAAGIALLAISTITLSLVLGYVIKKTKPKAQKFEESNEVYKMSNNLESLMKEMAEFNKRLNEAKNNAHSVAS